MHFTGTAVVEVQEMFSSHGGLLTNAMYLHGNAAFASCLNASQIVEPDITGDKCYVLLRHFCYICYQDL